MLPLAFSNTSPAAAPPVVLRLAFTLMVPAYTLMGPEMLVLLPIVTVSVWAVLPMSLPIVKPLTVLANDKLDIG